MIQSLNVNVDPASLFAQFGATSIPPITAQQNAPTLQPEADNVPVEREHSENTQELNETEREGEMRMVEAVEEWEEVEQQLPTIEKSTGQSSVMAEVPEETQFESIPMEAVPVNELMEEAEQPLLTPEEFAANVAAMDSETDERDMEVDGDRVVGWNPTERVENTTVETPENGEVVDVADEEKETEKVPPRDEVAEARAVAVCTYQRRQAREETSGKRSEEERPRETPIQRTGDDMNSSARSAVGSSCRRRRLITNEEPEEEEDVFFTPIDALPSSGQPDPPTEVEDRERERRERKRKGKAIATPLKKKPRQASTTMVIQE